MITLNDTEASTLSELTQRRLNDLVQKIDDARWYALEHPNSDVRTRYTDQLKRLTAERTKLELVVSKFFND